MSADGRDGSEQVLWEQAMNDAVAKMRANIARFGDQFPKVSKDGQYVLNQNDDWTCGFWPGILWLSYEYTGERIFRDKAVEAVDSLRRRLEEKRHLDHHDIGFLYTLSALAWWKVEQAEAARKLALQAADALMLRWRPAIGIIQAWGAKNDPQNGGRMIIDCLMNLPLLYWASEQTGKVEYAQVAAAHAEKTRRYIVRGDDSSYHTFYFDQETGQPIRGATQQGYRDGSTWCRGQAWGIYGFALSYRYTGNPQFLETSKRMAHYFINHLPPDHVAYWDFDVPVQEDTERDSSASAIAVCGMMELLSQLDAQDEARHALEQAIGDSMQALYHDYSTIAQPDAQGLLEHGSYSVIEGKSPDDFMIWGDYFYMQAMMGMLNDHKGYWYV